jgi:hypothetical protein
MAIILGVLFLGAGLIVSAHSGTLAARAAGRRPIPLWRNGHGYRRPPASVRWQVAAVPLIGIGAIFLLYEWGTVAILLLGLVSVPALAVIAVHNKLVRTKETAVTVRTRSTNSAMIFLGCAVVVVLAIGLGSRWLGYAGGWALIPAALVTPAFLCFYSCLLVSPARLHFHVRRGNKTTGLIPTKIARSTRSRASVDPLRPSLLVSSVS